MNRITQEQQQQQHNMHLMHHMPPPHQPSVSGVLPHHLQFYHHQHSQAAHQAMQHARQQQTNSVWGPTFTHHTTMQHPLYTMTQHPLQTSLPLMPLPSVPPITISPTQSQVRFPRVASSLEICGASHLLYPIYYTRQTAAAESETESSPQPSELLCSTCQLAIPKGDVMLAVTNIPDFIDPHNTAAVDAYLGQFTLNPSPFPPGSIRNPTFYRHLECAQIHHLAGDTDVSRMRGFVQLTLHQQGIVHHRFNHVRMKYQFSHGIQTQQTNGLMPPPPTLQQNGFQPNGTMQHKPDSHSLSSSRASGASTTPRGESGRKRLRPTAESDSPPSTPPPPEIPHNPNERRAFEKARQVVLNHATKLRERSPGRRERDRERDREEQESHSGNVGVIQARSSSSASLSHPTVSASGRPQREITRLSDPDVYAPRSLNRNNKHDMDGKPKRRRAKKDPTAPKRPASNYMFWCTFRRPQLKALEPDVNSNVLMRKMALEWKTMDRSTEAMKKWDDLHERDRNRYQRQMQQWRDTGKYKHELDLRMVWAQENGLYDQELEAQNQGDDPEDEQYDDDEHEGEEHEDDQEEFDEPELADEEDADHHDPSHSSPSSYRKNVRTKTEPIDHTMQRPSSDEEMEETDESPANKFSSQQHRNGRLTNHTNIKSGAAKVEPIVKNESEGGHSGESEPAASQDDTQPLDHDAIEPSAKRRKTLSSSGSANGATRSNASSSTTLADLLVAADASSRD